MKIKLLCLIVFSLLCLSMFSCSKANDPPVSTDPKTDVISDTEKKTETEATSNIEKTIETNETSEFWHNLSEMGGSENPYRELYGTAVSGFLIIEGTFTKTKTYYDEAGQEKFNNILQAYGESSKDVPLLVYLFREMGITKQEYIDYLNALSPDRSQEDYKDNIDVVFSDNDDLINETFHNPLTLYHEGKIYTIYDLAEIYGKESLNSFPKEKVAELYNNILAFNEKEHIIMPDEMDNMFNEMAAIASSVGTD